MSDAGPTLGVLGGMGPLATTRFMERVVERTPADRDQDHLRMVVVSDPTVPDRTAAILEDGPSPVEPLRENARALEREGATLVAVPCNTFHYFYDDVQAAVTVPIVHMIRVVARHLERRGVERVGLLATTGTIRARVYHDALDGTGVEVVEPRDPDAVMDAIYDIKAGERDGPRAALSGACDRLLSRGASTVVAGCTEIPLVLDDHPSVVDPMSVMASVCVERLTGRAAVDPGTA